MVLAVFAYNLVHLVSAPPGWLIGFTAATLRFRLFSTVESSVAAAAAPPIRLAVPAEQRDLVANAFRKTPQPLANCNSFCPT